MAIEGVTETSTTSPGGTKRPARFSVHVAVIPERIRDSSVILTVFGNENTSFAQPRHLISLE
jgi:hypothetical protein